MRSGRFLCLECGNPKHDDECSSVMIEWKLFTEEQRSYLANLGTLAFQILERIKEEPLSLARVSSYEALEIPWFFHYRLVKSVVEKAFDAEGKGFMELEITNFGKAALQFSPM